MAGQVIRRRRSLRLSLANINQKKKKKHFIVGKLRGRYHFRAAVRLVLEYMDWMTDEPPIEEVGDNIAVNVKMAQRKQTPEKNGLTIEDRSILLINPVERTRENRAYIMRLIRNLRAFKKYPDNLRDSLAAVCRYQYLPADRVIVRQHHRASTLYYIVRGEISLSQVVTDSVTGDTTEHNVGVIGPGDMFGEIALLHDIPRTTTVVTKTAVDLLYLTRDDFDRILKITLLEEWDVLQDAMINFNYFKAWDNNIIRECCILSKIKNYEPNEVLLGDGKGMVNYVYFILAGECRLIEHMIVRQEHVGRNVKYQLYKPDKHSKSLQVCTKRPSTKIEVSEEDIDYESDIQSNVTIEPEIGTEVSDTDYAQLLLTMKPVRNIDMERMSIVTTTLQDVVNQWHEITEVAAMLMKEPSTISQQQYPKNVRTIFMQICKFYRGACFGLGEHMHNRRIVSITPVRCLLVPRYWLLEHNRANIWERVKLFLDSKYPTEEQLFQKFVRNRKWLKYKQELVKNIIKNGRRVHNTTTIHDVPYSIRINEEINVIS